MLDFIFIDGYSGLGKTTLAKSLFSYYKSVYIEQNMIPEFITLDGKQKVFGALEEKTCFTGTIALLKNFNELGYKNVIALDFDEIRFRDIPEIFKGKKFIILRLICEDINQNIRQMNNRGEGLIDTDMLVNNYSRDLKFPRPLLPNEVRLNITNKSPQNVFEEAISIINNFNSQIDYSYTKPPKDCFGTWVKNLNQNIKND